jgi:flagellar protein FliL
MSDAAAPGAKTAEPKKGKKKLIIIIAVALLLTGGGGAFYYFRQSKAEAKENKKENKEEKESKDEPEEEGKKSHSKASKSEDDEEEQHDETEEESPKKKNKSAAISLPDDSKVKAVVELQPYIVNLADPGEARYLRMAVSVGIGGEEKEEKPNPLFTTRIRNAMLAVLTTKTSEEVLTAEGKVKLRKDLLRAARAACEEPRVEAIYITEFIIQL